MSTMGTMTTPGGLGRRHAPDPRDANYPLRALLPTARSLRTYRYWNASGFWFDQGPRPICVGAAWAEWLEDGPVTHPGPTPILTPEAIYAEAQTLDEWPGTNYDGTSVRAGAKAVQAHGLIASYHWASTLDEIVQCLLDVGPVVVGFNWYSSMDEPDPVGFVHVGGTIRGGHAFKLDGVNTATRIIRAKNSWGRAWGHQGFFYLGFDDVARLLSEEGEACLAVEVKVPAIAAA